MLLLSLPPSPSHPHSNTPSHSHSPTASLTLGASPSNTASISLSSILLLSLAYSLIQVDITDPQLTMGEQVSFTRFLCCACHDRGGGSAFFGARRAAELHISHSAGCKNACKGVQSVPVLYRDSQRQEEAGLVGTPGHLPARPVAQKVPPPTRHTHMIPDIGMHGFHIGI
jgi:hypothetical protein